MADGRYRVLHNANKTPPFNSESKKVEICVVFNKIGEIDTVHEEFTADVLVKARWRDPSLDGMFDSLDIADTNWQEDVWDPMIFVENTIGETKETVTRKIVFDKYDQAYVHENRRIKSKFVENLELSDFPFDVQDLTIIVASERTSKEVQFEDNPEEMHRICNRSFVDAQEWNLYKHIDIARDEYNDDMTDDATHAKPMYLVRCRAARRSTFFIVNNYSFFFLVTMLTYTTFCVDYQTPQHRLDLTFLLILTTVLFKLATSRSLPNISYTTYMDYYSLASFGVILVTCIWHAVTAKIPESVGFWINDVVLCILVGAYLLFNAAYVFFIYNTVLEKRRLMLRKDNDYIYRSRVLGGADHIYGTARR